MGDSFLKYFIDSAKMDEVKYAVDNWRIDGITTNPRHIKTSGLPFLKVIESLAAEFRGMDLPISVEINPHLDTAKEMVAQAKRIAELSEQFVIKLPCFNEGLIAANELEKEGIRTNITLVFSPSQALQAGRLNAKFVSPFIAWKESSGEDCTAYISDIVQIYRNYNIKTEIIVAAIRNAKQIVDAAKTGADIVTCGFDVYKESFEHPFTQYGLDIFTESWDATDTGDL